jgi:hypothetical protein
MGAPEIFEKLAKTLENPSLSESEVIYILSRVRKLLEIDYLKSPKENREKSPILWFYCSFALHVIMDHELPDPIYKNLIAIKDGADYSSVGFSNFHEEFRNFLKRKGLPESIYTLNRISEFNARLLSIFSNTPILLKRDKYEVKFDKNGIISFSQYKKVEDLFDQF